MYVSYSQEVKSQAIQMRNAGKSVSEISKELRIAESTLYRWFKLYSTTQSIAEEQLAKEVTNLSAEYKHLQNVLDVIRQSGYIKEIPLQRRLGYAVDLYNQKPGFSAREIYEALDIAKGTFYYRLNHRSEISEKEKAKYTLMLKIHEIFEDSNQVFGAEKIRAMLAREGLRVSNKRVSALMRELGLESVRVDAKKQYKIREKHLKKNLVQRNFRVNEPNKIWVSDITEFRVKGKWYYLCVIIDLYSRKVVSFCIC